jgi:dolichol-phosphate mannosyltransferase
MHADSWIKCTGPDLTFLGYSAAQKFMVALVSRTSFIEFRPSSLARRRFQRRLPMRYSVILPQRNVGYELHSQVRQLCEVLNGLEDRYELLCVDDCSTSATVSLLEQMLRQEPALRVLRVTKQSGLSYALSAGIAAARGTIVIAMDGCGRYRAEQLPELLHGLSRADAVFGQRRIGLAGKTWQRVARLPRWSTLGLEVRDPSCVFWAARREALDGIPLARGMYRYLSTLIASRGFRVTEVYVDHAPLRAELSDGWPNPADLLMTWWLSRRLQWPAVEELGLQAVHEKDERRLRHAA